MWQWLTGKDLARLTLAVAPLCLPDSAFFLPEISSAFPTYLSSALATDQGSFFYSFIVTHTAHRGDTYTTPYHVF